MQRQSTVLGASTVRALWAALAVWSLTTVAPAIPPESDVWHERESVNFRIQGNAPESVTAGYALRFERLRAALGILNPAIPMRGAGKVDVFVFRDPASFRPYARIFANSDITYPAGYFRSAEYRDVIAILPPRPDEPPADAAYTAYLIELLRAALPNAPEWVRDGLAQVYASASIEDGAVVVGRPDTLAIRFLRANPLLPCRQLLSVLSPPKPVVRGPSVFRAQSWALVHYLLVSDEGRRRRFTSYLGALAGGAAPEGAFSSAIGITPEELDGILPAYVRQDRFAFLRVPIAALRAAEAPPASRLARPEVLTRLGWLLASLDPVNARDSESHFREALALRPGDTAALAGLGWVRSRDGRYDEAAESYDKAIAAEEKNALWRLLAARNLLARAGAQVGPGQAVAALPEEVARARALLEGALAISPDDGEIHAAYGATWTWDPGDVRPGIAALETATAKLPPRADLFLNLVTLYARTGDRQKVQSLIDGPLTALGDTAAVDAARVRLAFADLYEVDRKLQAGDLEAALEILRRGRDSTSDESMRARFESEIARVEPVAARNRLVALFNEAVELANEGDWKGAAALCEQVLAGEPDDELRARAEEIVKRGKGQAGNTRR